MINHFIEHVLFKRLNDKQKQWGWFCLLWGAGLSAVLLLSLFIKALMGV